ncbi:hypothetical protein ABKN59_009693 [Abortiporus biennis]
MKILGLKVLHLHFSYLLGQRCYDMILTQVYRFCSVPQNVNGCCGRGSSRFQDTKIIIDLNSIDVSFVVESPLPGGCSDWECFDSSM